MVVSHFGVRAVVDKEGETCDQGRVCRQSNGKHVTRAVLSTEGLLDLHCSISEIQAISYDSMHFPCLSLLLAIEEQGW